MCAYKFKLKLINNYYAGAHDVFYVFEVYFNCCVTKNVNFDYKKN